MSKYPNSGALYRNEKKRPDHDDPEYTGSAEVDGVEYWLSAWVKDGQQGKGKFMSISFKPKENKPKASVETPKQPETTNDALPF